MPTALDPLQPSSTHADRDDHGLHVLALNSGSSSLKFGLYRVLRGEAALLAEGHTEPAGAAQGIDRLLAAGGLPAPQAIGHRFVHGGPSLRQHCRFDPEVLTRLEAATPFAPLHMPAALAIVRLALQRFPGLPQVVCFDTAFHAGMPEAARTLALPRALRDEGIQRYGFHGLSCESIVRRLAAEGPLPRRLLIAHLGSGASVTAVLDGVSVDTSMGLTPSGGLVMATRSGDLDPGLLIYLMREKQLAADGLEDLVDRRSGLLGISGVSGDMRALHAVAESNPAARLAIHMFCHAVAKQLAAMCVTLNGVDLIVFTGGIGENDARVRADICGRLSWLGVGLDKASPCQVRVLPCQEEAQIARHAWALR